MEYESIEQEVKAENLRKHEREEAAAIRAHDLAMAKVNRKILHVPVHVMVVSLAAAVGFSIFLTSIIVSSQTSLSLSNSYRSELKYQTLQSHAAGVQAGLSQGRTECREGE